MHRQQQQLKLTLKFISSSALRFAEQLNMKTCARYTYKVNVAGKKFEDNAHKAK